MYKSQKLQRQSLLDTRTPLPTCDKGETITGSRYGAPTETGSISQKTPSYNKCDPKPYPCKSLKT